MAIAEAQHASDGPQTFVLLSDRNPINVTNDTRGQAISDSYLRAIRVEYLTPWFEVTSITSRRDVQADMDFSSQPILNLHDEHAFTQWARRLRCEAARDVDGWYHLIDPLMRNERERKREDEPETTKTELREFMAQIPGAELIDIHVTRFMDSAPGVFRGRPVAFVTTVVKYNSSFSTAWVHENGQWYTRALGKLNWPKFEA